MPTKSTPCRACLDSSSHQEEHCTILLINSTMLWKPRTYFDGSASTFRPRCPLSLVNVSLLCHSRLFCSYPSDGRRSSASCQRTLFGHSFESMIAQTTLPSIASSILLALFRWMFFDLFIRVEAADGVARHSLAIYQRGPLSIAHGLWLLFISCELY